MCVSRHTPRLDVLMTCLGPASPRRRVGVVIASPIYILLRFFLLASPRDIKISMLSYVMRSSLITFNFHPYILFICVSHSQWFPEADSPDFIHSSLNKNRKSSYKYSHFFLTALPRPRTFSLGQPTCLGLCLASLRPRQCYSLCLVNTTSPTSLTAVTGRRTP